MDYQNFDGLLGCNFMNNQFVALQFNILCCTLMGATIRKLG